jgi:septal ring factor EnvC (AmiA/AmiB activator)
LDQARDDVVGACLARWEEEQENARLRLALASAKRGRSQLRARVADLEAERHSTNEALDDAVQALRADRDRIAELERRIAAEECRCPEPAPLCEGCRCKCHAGQAQASADKLTALFAPTQVLREEPVAEAVPFRVQAMRALLDGQRAAVEDPHDGPLHHSYRVPRDLPETGGR